MIFRALFFCISTLREFLRVFALSREKKFFKGKGHFRNCLLVAACFLFLSFSCYGQVDPVQGTAGLIPPYALRLSDYTTSSSERFALNILLADLTKADLHVRFRISITGQNVKLETKPEYIGSMITMQGGVFGAHAKSAALLDALHGTPATT